jgi:hypothetical protein
VFTSGVGEDGAVALCVTAAKAFHRAVRVFGQHSFKHPILQSLYLARSVLSGTDCEPAH